MRFDDEEMAVLESMVGRTVTAVVRHPDEHSQGGDDAIVVLDDGSAVRFTGWGHDWWGLSVAATRVMHVESCLACGQPHPNSEVCEPWGDHYSGDRPYLTRAHAWCPTSSPSECSWLGDPHLD